MLTTSIVSLAPDSVIIFYTDRHKLWLQFLVNFKIPTWISGRIFFGTWGKIQIHNQTIKQIFGHIGDIHISNYLNYPFFETDHEFLLEYWGGGVTIPLSPHPLSPHPVSPPSPHPQKEHGTRQPNRK